MPDPRPVTPLGFALGFGLAFSATIGIFTAYWIGHGNPALFWSALVGSLLIGGALGYGLRRFVTVPESSAKQESDEQPNQDNKNQDNKESAGTA